MDPVNEISRKISPYFERESRVTAAYLFGSFARGSQRPNSDVDIAILLDESHGKIDRKNLYDRLLPQLGRLLRQDVHILILNDASYLARIEALSRGRLLHVKDDEALARFRMVSFALFADYAPYLRELQQKLRRRLMDGHG
jgi:predicted nucleotidyltransferase